VGLGDGIGKTLAWEAVGKVLLVVHATRPPAREEWNKFLDECGSIRTVRGCLVLASDVQLDALQRKEIGNLVKRMGIERVAVITGSRVTQSVVTALGWLTGVHKGFLPHQIVDAMSFLKVDENDNTALLVRARSLAALLQNPLIAEVKTAV